MAAHLSPLIFDNVARTLRILGACLLAAAVWLFLAGTAGWVEEPASSSLGRDVALAGLLCLGAGFVAGMFGRAGRALKRGHCVRCGARTEWDQTYCLDHLLETVEEYRMRTPEGGRSRSGPSGHRSTGNQRSSSSSAPQGPARRTPP